MFTKKIILASICLLLCAMARSQSYTGIWQGYIKSPGSYISGYSLNIIQQEGNIITGKAYLYHNTLYYAKGKFDFVGVVKGNTLKITELKIVDSIIKKDSAALCLKLLSLELIPKNGMEYLVGDWHGDTYLKNECDPGKAYLRRYTPKDPDGIEPIPEQVLTMISQDKPIFPFQNTTLAKPIIVKVARNVLTLSLSDYLKADHDTVSVYYNRNPVVKNLHLLKKAKKYTIRLDKLSGLNEVIMYAENLGEVPPNTSTLIVDDGIKKQTVIISSTLQTSAVIYLQYEPVE